MSVMRFERIILDSVWMFTFFYFFVSFQQFNRKFLQRYQTIRKQRLMKTMVILLHVKCSIAHHLACDVVQNETSPRDKDTSLRTQTEVVVTLDSDLTRNQQKMDSCHPFLTSPQKLYI